MNTILNEGKKTFKDLEQELYRVACDMAVDMAKEILNKKDDEIFIERDKEKYKSEGLRKTSIKTVLSI